MEDGERRQVTARTGFFPLVAGGDVHVHKAGAVVMGAKGDLRLSQGGGQWLVALGNQTVSQGGGGVLISRAARVTNGFVGVLVAAPVTLEGNARALLAVPPRVAVAAAAAFALGWLAGRRRRGTADRPRRPQRPQIL